MREIIFRGIPKDDTVRHFFADTWKENCEGSFVYGSLVVAHDRYYICVSAMCSTESCINNGLTSMIKVIPSSVSEFTGLCDKNGKKIFEGDIVKIERDLWHGENKKEREIFNGVVWYDEKHTCFGSKSEKYKCLPIYRFKGDFTTVIGNIHDNPELLKGGEE